MPRFRIQKSPDQCLFANSPELFAGCRVFRRLSMPRHPPYTLKSLATFIDHRQYTKCLLSIQSNSLFARSESLSLATRPVPAGLPGRGSITETAPSARLVIKAWQLQLQNSRTKQLQLLPIANGPIFAKKVPDDTCPNGVCCPPIRRKNQRL